ncbi:hypothetical protein, partial [Streptococcus pneumoniae]
MTATLNLTEKQLLELSLTQVKSNEFRVLEVETGSFEDGQGEQREYARLLVCEKEEYSLLESVGMLERAEKVRFPVVQYDGSDLSEKVGKIIVTDNPEQWFFKKSKVDVGFGRQETQIVGMSYKVNMS